MATDHHDRVKTFTLEELQSGAPHLCALAENVKMSVEHGDWSGVVFWLDRMATWEMMLRGAAEWMRDWSGKPEEWFARYGSGREDGDADGD